MRSRGSVSESGEGRESNTKQPGAWAILTDPNISLRCHCSCVTMGIQGLAKLIADVAPSAIRENDIKSYFGRKVAIDASMSIYQFLIAVRQGGDVLQNEEGRPPAT